MAPGLFAGGRPGRGVRERLGCRDRRVVPRAGRRTTLVWGRSGHGRGQGQGCRVRGSQTADAGREVAVWPQCSGGA
eukprot:9378962-Alexandrium_andersonii.AAC.1